MVTCQKSFLLGFLQNPSKTQITTHVSLIKVSLKIRVMTTNYFDSYDYKKGYGKILPNELTSFEEILPFS